MLGQNWTLTMDVSTWLTLFKVDEDFLAVYQMNYGFTPDGEQADTTTNDTQVTAADETQTSDNQVLDKYISLVALPHVTISQLMHLF